MGFIDDEGLLLVFKRLLVCSILIFRTNFKVVLITLILVHVNRGDHEKQRLYIGECKWRTEPTEGCCKALNQ